MNASLAAPELRASRRARNVAKSAHAASLAGNEALQACGR